jgi:GMP synthase (glutamine-hydrolysing)
VSKVIVIQHHPIEGLGRLAQILRVAEIEVELVGPSALHVPRLTSATKGLIVLGGPAGVYETEEHPRLREELRLIEAALGAELPVLGICLGSQLLAAALGARVFPGPAKEIGWAEVTLTEAASRDALFRHLPERFRALHWHGDIFELPTGAVALARSENTENQAFSYGSRAFGLLFHLEADVPQVEAMCSIFGDEARASGAPPADIEAATRLNDAAASELASTLFGEWVKLVER